MKRAEWAKPTSNEAAYRRAGGRNALQSGALYCCLQASRCAAAAAQKESARRGDLAHLARQLGVSKATVCRDVAQLHRSKSLGPADPTFAQILREMKRAGF